MRELLRSVADSLDAVPLEVLVTADQVLDRTALLLAVRNAADAELTRTVRRAENIRAPERDGLRSMRYLAPRRHRDPDRATAAGLTQAAVGSPRERAVRGQGTGSTANWSRSASRLARICGRMSRWSGSSRP